MASYVGSKIIISNFDTIVIVHQLYLLISDGSISNLVMCLGLTRVACCSRSKMISRNRMEAGAILLRMRHGAGHINDIAAILIQYHYCSLHSPFHMIL